MNNFQITVSEPKDIFYKGAILLINGEERFKVADIKNNTLTIIPASRWRGFWNGILDKFVALKWKILETYWDIVDRFSQ